MEETQLEYENKFIIESDNEEDVDMISDIHTNFKKLQIEEKIQNKFILSIDIGIHHLGLSLTETDKDYNIKEIVWVDLVNISKFNCNREICPLYHTKTVTDWIAHFFYTHKEFLEQSDHVLIERQPIGGIQAVEQYIFGACRNVAELISPNSVHKFFGIGDKNYDQRKEMTEKIAKYYLDKVPNIKKQYDDYERQHDIADSICFTIFWCAKKREQIAYNKKIKEREERIQNIKIRQKNGEYISLDELMERYKYIPHPKILK